MLQTLTPRQGGSQVSALQSQNRYKHLKPPASLRCWAPPTPHPQWSGATVPQNPCSPKSEPWDTVLSHKTPQGWWAAQTHPAQPCDAGLIHLILFWHEHLCGDQVQASGVPGGGPAGGGTRSRAPAEAPRQALIPQALGCSLSTDLWQPRCPLPLCSLSAPVPTLHQLCLQCPLPKTGLFIFSDGTGFCSFAMNQYFTSSPTVLILKEMSGRWSVHFGATEDGVSPDFQRQREKILIG